MPELQQNITSALQHFAEGLRKSRLPAALAVEIEKLIAQVDQPCVVAVVGRVKAGKSTFVNALLGSDLAKVGTSETTATINYFSYGKADPERPVRCYWRNGATTQESYEFLQNLQGNDLETLRRATGIARLEYFLPVDFLKQITLVDTPGTNAVVDQHQNMTADWLKLHSQLRERHHQETERLTSEADAVIYLTDPVARVTDRDFLEEFSHVTGGQSRAFNAIGVMAQVDKSPELQQRRHELAEKISRQLRDSLNTVIPVSAGVHRALDNLLANDHARLRQFAQALAQLPTDRLELLLSSDELFLQDSARLPISLSERQQMVAGMPWGVFTTIARAVRSNLTAPTLVIAQLRELSGFEQLRKTLEQRFFTRGQLLRWYRIVNDARRIHRSLQYTHIPKMREQERKNRQRFEQFLTFVSNVQGDANVKHDLQDFLRMQLRLTGREHDIQEFWNQTDEQLSALYHELEEHNADFVALQQIEEGANQFSDEERNELQPLFGLYGAELEQRLAAGAAQANYVRERQLAWRLVEYESAAGSSRRQVAERAQTRYGLILDELLS
jgi:GTPase Era involved in 16S rRNA processing